MSRLRHLGRPADPIAHDSAKHEQGARSALGVSTATLALASWKMLLFEFGLGMVLSSFVRTCVPMLLTFGLVGGTGLGLGYSATTTSQRRNSPAASVVFRSRRTPGA